MNTKRTSAPNCAETVPVRYEVVDKFGRVRKPTFRTAQAAGEWARMAWPDEDQDEDRTGAGWDVQICGCDS